MVAWFLRALLWDPNSQAFNLVLCPQRCFSIHDTLWHNMATPSQALCSPRFCCPCCFSVPGAPGAPAATRVEPLLPPSPKFATGGTHKFGKSDPQNDAIVVIKGLLVTHLEGVRNVCFAQPQHATRRCNPTFSTFRTSGSASACNPFLQPCDNTACSYVFYVAFCCSCNPTLQPHSSKPMSAEEEAANTILPRQ